jgi:6-phosphogluconolactonase
MISSFRVKPGTGEVEPIRRAAPAEGRGPCHVALDCTGRTAIAVNFHLGTVASMPVGEDGATGKPRIVTHQGKGVHPTRQATAHPHSSLVLVCDLGLDRIFTYRLNADDATLTPGSPPFASTESGSGPRHMAFSADGKRLYAINEISNTVAVYDYEPGAGALARRQTLSTLPSGFAGESSAAELALHPGGRHLYASNRGHDSLALFAVDAVSGQLSARGHFPAGGKAPRHFALSADGRWLVCAHQESDTLCAFRVDPADGRLDRVPGTVSVPAPTCVLVFG